MALTPFRKKSVLCYGKAKKTMIVGKGVKEFHVHKAILAARSQVFAAMFEHDCEEKRQNKVIITDMDEDVCGEMLSFVYSGKVKSMEKYAIELLEAADKYQMDSMKNLCEQYMSSSLSIETAANVLIVANLYRANGLKSMCIEYMVGHAKEVMQTKGWNELAKTQRADLVMELFSKLAYKDN